MSTKTKYWDHIEGATGAEYQLFFEMFYEYEPIAKITLDIEGYPCVTSDLLNKYEEPLFDSITPEKAKEEVERMVTEQYQDEIDYYSHLLRKFSEE